VVHPPFQEKGEAFVPVPIFKYFAVIGSSLLVLLLVSDTYLVDDESHLRFDRSLYVSALYAPRVEKIRPRDVTPAVRVREVFAVFDSNERRRNRRDS
jgi:hypothetical protein